MALLNHKNVVKILIKSSTNFEGIIVVRYRGEISISVALESSQRFVSVVNWNRLHVGHRLELRFPLLLSSSLLLPAFSLSISHEFPTVILKLGRGFPTRRFVNGYANPSGFIASARGWPFRLMTICYLELTFVSNSINSISLFDHLRIIVLWQQICIFWETRGHSKLFNASLFLKAFLLFFISNSSKCGRVFTRNICKQMTDKWWKK